MIWLELRRNKRIYNEGWNFTESVWAPTKKENGARWPFWYLINDIKKDDVIFHLRHIDGNKVFTGYSKAVSDSYTTRGIPTNDRHEWDFIDSFFKVDLTNYSEFKTPIQLSEFFQSNDQELREYFTSNKRIRTYKKRLFYVIQSGRLQCLNGAYFSEFDERLVDLLTSQIDIHLQEGQTVITGDTLAELRTRIGHRQFAENVKRNFNYKCCFPGCEIHGRGFLVSGHIARWADNHELRGNTQNGLCLCLLHDRAFEKGHFTLDQEFNIKIIEDNLNHNEWLSSFLNKGKGQPIKSRTLDPMIEALRKHWKRIGYNRDV